VTLRNLAQGLVSNWRGAFAISLRSACALLLTFFLMAGSIGSAFAHALPGSVLVFSENEDYLSFTITFSLEDLIIVEPKFESLANVESGTSPSKKALTALRHYIEAHVALSQTSRPLPIRLINATLTEANNEHVGTYSQIELQLVSTPIKPTRTFPLSLKYDALMHEIRSHRVTVYWQNDDVDDIEPLTGVVDFGYRMVDGNPQTYEIAHP
jgi:hypothetical protein